ncbi:MAG: PilC/PilY family type IV pilus protein, partial [Syntrophobacteria bacterium]
MNLVKSKYLIFSIFLGFSLIMAGFSLDQAGAQALDNCPYPPFSSTETGKPNILIILDHSGSMGSGAGSRWVTAQGVVKDIIDDFPNVRFGLMRMDGSKSAVKGAADNISIESPYLRQGGKLLKPVGTPGSEIIAYIDNWGEESNRPQTWTNLAETLATAGQYFATVEVAGYHTGSDDAATLTDSNADFVDDGIQTGDIVFNTTDGSYGSITAVTNTTITATLTGGSDNDWDADDSYTTTKKAGKGPAGFGAYDKPYHPANTYSKCYYRTGKLSSGASGEDPYIDQGWDISTQPTGFQNHTAIRTYYADRYNTTAEVINIDLPVAATVYVAYQSGKTLPTWLGGYTDTGDTATVTASTTVTFKIYQKSFDAGIVTLGGNQNGSGDAEYTYFAYVSLPGGINDCIASNSDDTGRYVDATSPIENECQQSFIIFLTDGLANYDNDWNIVTDVIGDYDNDGDSDDRKHTGSSADEGRTSYLDDVAKYLYDNDMRSDIEGTQNLVTYVVGFFINDPLLSNAATNGGGLYFTASSADALTTALQRAITDILDRISAGTAVSTITTSSASDDYLVRAKFLPASWKGFLETFTLPFVEGETPLWEAGDVLADRIALNTADDREIFTYMTSESPKKQDFEAINSTLVDTLNTEWSESSDSEIQDMIDFIRGDDSNDGGKYRDRKGWFLGDIIYSTPRVVGSPRSFFLENDYQEFKSTYLNRTTMIYVGANDGMLHGFNAADGSEGWAFIPENIRPNLSNLTLDSCHQYYVDLSPMVYDIWDETWVTAGNEWTGWKTV